MMTIDTSKDQNEPTDNNSQGLSLFRTDRVMSSLRHAEFDVNSTIGELADNSLEGDADDVWIFVQTTEAKEGKKKTTEVVSEIAVVDNGIGMAKDILHRALVLGESARPMKPGGRRGIGRFGVGLTLGGISVARRLEVYSRIDKKSDFLFTYLDLDDVEKKVQSVIPLPVPKAPPKEYAKLLEGRAGTIVVLQKCDRLAGAASDAGKQVAVTELKSGLPNYLGRTYRKFIAAGRNIHFNGEHVYLHDPLYLLAPTRFEMAKPEPKAIEYGTESIELDMPGDTGKKASVTLKLTLLPLDWRRRKDESDRPGGSQFAKDRRIHENEGISILRADREVLYGIVPYITGTKGQAKTLDIDRWWGCEISFPPELDDYFHVRFIKRGAEPIPWLRDQIRSKIAKAIEELRKRIIQEFEKSEEEQAREQGVFHAAEEAMANAERLLPRGRPVEKDKNTDAKNAEPAETQEQADEKKLEEIAAEDVSDDEKTPDEKKERLRQKAYALVPVKYPAQLLFETEHLLGRIIIKLNVNHPFYKKVFEPLCGTADSIVEGEELPDAGTPQQRIAREGLILLLFSYAKAETLLNTDPNCDTAAMLQQLRAQWGLTLATVLNNRKEGQ